MRKNTSFSAIVIGIILLLSACSNAGTGTGTESGNVSDSYMPFSNGKQEVLSTQADSAVDTGTKLDDANIVHTGNASIVTDKPEEKSAEFVTYVGTLNGRIDSTSQYDTGNGMAVQITARVPETVFTEAMANLDTYGKVSSRDISSYSVSLEVTDLEARIGALEASVSRLKELLAKAETTEAVIQAESELSSRQAELDGLNSQLKYLNDQVSMSTIYVSFETANAYAVSSPGVWDAFLTSLKTLGYGIVVAIPWAIVLGLITWAGVFIYRKASKRRETTSAEVIIETTDPK